MENKIIYDDCYGDEEGGTEWSEMSYNRYKPKSITDELIVDEYDFWYRKQIEDFRDDYNF